LLAVRITCNSHCSLFVLLAVSCTRL